jgi:hypothetical protein
MRGEADLTFPIVVERETMARTMIRLTTAACLLCVTAGDRADAAPGVGDVTYDVVVYGGTPGGVMTAVAAARHGRSVALVEPGAHVGGVVSGGLVYTDIGKRETVGGLADEFLKRVVAHYRDTYGTDSRQFLQCKQGIKYEPHVAEVLFERMLGEQKAIVVAKRQRLRSAARRGDRVVAIEVDDLAEGRSRTYAGRVFVDATYEGDLMASLRVPFRVGREGRREYGEALAGITKGPAEVIGTGDHRTQAFNYRVSLTFHPENRVKFPRPEHYDPEPWRSTYGARIKRMEIERFGDLFVTFDIDKQQPNDKLDTNWCDLTGGSEGYAEGDWETRARIEARHRDYFLSLLYYLQNDPDLPAKFHDEVQNWGLPLDEFGDNGHFPHQIYVREARRMLGRYVLTERDLTDDRYKPDGVCAGSYGIDCHTVQDVVIEGKREHEGNLTGAVRPYDIPYACLTPHEVENLLVPVCLSASHVAYSSVRMEPVYMMLGHAAGVAAHLVVAGDATVQQADVAQLRRLLREEGAVLDAGYQPTVRIDWTPARPRPGELVRFRATSGDLKEPLANVWWDFSGNGTIAAEGEEASFSFPIEKAYNVSLLVADRAGRRRLVTAEVPVGRAIGRDVTVDDTEAELSGRWAPYVPDVYSGPFARRDMVLRGETMPARARFHAAMPRAGRYQVCLGLRPDSHQATAVEVKLRHAGGLERIHVNERAGETPFPFAVLGEYRFSPKQEAVLEVANGNADGRVVIDAVRWVWIGD